MKRLMTRNEDSSYTEEAVANIIIELLGGERPCNLFGIDEWLSYHCDDMNCVSDIQDCWVRYLRNKENGVCRMEGYTHEV